MLRSLIGSSLAKRVPLAGRRFNSTDAKPPGSGGLWSAYLHALERRPVLVKAVTSGFLTFTADILCQLYFPSKAVLASVEDEKRKNNADKKMTAGDASSSILQDFTLRLGHLDTKRLGIFTFLGVVYIAPCLHVWYGFLMRAIQGVSAQATLTRVFFDQTCFAPTFLAGLFAGGLILEGRTDAIQDKLIKDLPPTVKMNWTIWIPSMLIMFRFCPAHLQVLFSNSIGFFWNIYLTWAMNKEVDDCTMIVLRDGDDHTVGRKTG